MTVHVYTSGDQVQLRLNDKVVGTEPVLDAAQMISSFVVPYVRGKLVAVASKRGREIGRKTLKTVGRPAAIRLTSDVAALTTDRDELAHVLVEVIDRTGNRVPDAVAKIDFAVEGPGEIVGIGNGNAHNVDSFQRHRHHTWHGQALAIVRPKRSVASARGIELTATATGLADARLFLPVAARREPPP